MLTINKNTITIVRYGKRKQQYECRLQIDDIRRFFLLNFVNYNMSASPSMTAREIIAKMEKTSKVKGKGEPAE